MAAMADAPDETAALRRKDSEGVRVPRSYATAAAYSWRFLVIVLAVAVVVWFMLTLRIVVLPVIIGILLSSVLVRPLRMLRRRGVKPALASAIVLIATILLFVGVITLVSRSVAGQLSELTANIDKGIREIQDWLVTGPLALSREQVDSFAEQARSGATTNRARIISGVVSGVHLALEIGAGFLLSMFVLFFFLKDGDRIWAAIVGLFPPERQPVIDDAGRRSFVTVGAYLRGVSITALVDAVLIAIALVIVGVPLVIPLAALTFFAAFIPLVGATLAGTVAALVALVAKGPAAALVVVAAIVAIQQIEGHLLAPLVLGRAVQLHPLAIALSLAAGAVIGGVIGTLLAVPVTAVAATVVRTFREHSVHPPFDDHVDVGSA
jgi:predicted PurR-regulated permease PerM